MIKASLWKLLHRHWRNATESPAAGYTVLLPVPADLPVFLKIALGTCAAQIGTHRVETLVIPDGRSEKFEAVFNEAVAQNNAGPLRLVHLEGMDRLATRYSRSPHINHWLQLISGLDACRSTHAHLHDADAFLAPADFLENSYETCITKGYDVTGVNQVWDDWYRKNGFEHIVATWEAAIDVRWAKKFSPDQFRGQEFTINGLSHTSDTMLIPQCLTPGNRIGRVHNDRIVHFNYVICTFRHFQENARAGAKPFADDSFRVLLVRLLVNACQSVETEQDVPSIPELEQGLTSRPARVSYSKEIARGNYAEFRVKLQQLLGVNHFDEAAKARLLQDVSKFDAAFDWERSAVNTESNLCSPAS